MEEYFSMDYAAANIGKVVYFYGLWEAFEPHYIGMGKLRGFTSTGVKIDMIWGSDLNNASWLLNPDEVYLAYSSEKRPIFAGLPPFNIYKVSDRKETHYVIGTHEYFVGELLKDRDFHYRIVYNCDIGILKPF